VSTLNEVFTSLSMRRRYEVWFLRFALADGSGAWWFRYLLMNPGRGGCLNDSRGLPVQVWATWFPRGGKAQSFIQGFSLEEFELTAKGKSPLRFCVGENQIHENSCKGELKVDGHVITWDLRYQSLFRVTLSDKGWIGFSRTPHSDAVYAGEVVLDGRRFAGNPLGFGLQGHNCGYRHRNFWTWTHAYFPQANGMASTIEALIYEMPLGLVFRKVVLWHQGKKHIFRKLKESTTSKMQWEFTCLSRSGISIDASIDGRGASVHRLPYVKTDCSGSFEVVNNSLASATVLIRQPGQEEERLKTANGAVLEMVDSRD
jgi:hypothetical protein